MLCALLLASALASVPPTSPPTATAAPADAKNTTATTTFRGVDDKTYGPLIQQAHAGKIVVVNFWASYCQPCLVEIPDLLAIADKHKADVDVVFVGTDDPNEKDHAASILKRRRIALPATSSFIVTNADPRPFISRVDASWQGEMPTTVIYDRTGKKLELLVAAHSAAEFEAAIARAQAAAK
ncbi:MAG TPA: TlpA disulfide reductase family protein [Myxococcota bacterium]